jgi:hypothetical protein
LTKEKLLKILNEQPDVVEALTKIYHNEWKKRLSDTH